MATRRKTETETETEETLAPVEESRRPTVQGILLILLLFSLFFVGCTGVVGYIGLEIYDRANNVTPDDRPDDRRPGSRLADDLAKVIRGPDAEKHAKYFSIVCQGVAGRLKDDFSGTDQVYDQRSELVANVGLVGYFSAVRGIVYPGLDDVMQQVMEDSIGDKGGPVDEATENATVKMWNDLSEAFAEVAE